METTGHPVTLRLGISVLRRSHCFGFLLVLLGLPVALILALGITIAMTGGGEGGIVTALLELFRSTAEDEPPIVRELWAALALIPLLIGVFLLQGLGWLRIGPDGLSGYIPKGLGLGLTQKTVGYWEVPWDRIRAVRLVGPPTLPGGYAGRRLASVQAINRARLEIETDRRTIRLNPFVLYHPDAPDHRLSLRQLHRAAVLDFEDCLERTPLVRLLRERGLDIEYTDQASAAAVSPADVPLTFDLTQHRGMLAQLGLLLLAGLYALGDAFFLSPYVALEPLPLWPFALVVALAVPVVGWSGGGAPKAERLVVGALAVAALGLAVHPALLRANAATGEVWVAEYEAIAPGRFRAVAADLPEIDLSDRNLGEYWAARPDNASHRFTLVRGALGIHQLDLRPLHESTRAFYRRRRE